MVRTKIPLWMRIIHILAAEGPMLGKRLSERLGYISSTIYRNLEMLRDHGLVECEKLTSSLHGPRLYRLTPDGEKVAKAVAVILRYMQQSA